MGNYRTWAQNADANPLSPQLAECEAFVNELQEHLAVLRAEMTEANAERKALRQQVAELQAWKDAVPVAEIVRYTFDQYDSTTIRPSDDWHKIKDWMDVVSPE